MPGLPSRLPLPPLLVADPPCPLQHMWGTPNKTRGGAGRGAAAAAATGRAVAGAPPPPPPPSGAGRYDWLTVNLDDARRTDVMINILTGTRIPAADSLSNRYC